MMLVYYLQHLDALLKEVKDIMCKHSDMDVLEACSRMYDILCSGDLAIHNRVDLARTQLIDELVDQLNQLLHDSWREVRVDVEIHEIFLNQKTSRERDAVLKHSGFFLLEGTKLTDTA